MPEETGQAVEGASTQEPSQGLGESQAGEHAQSSEASAGNGETRAQTPQQKKELSRYERTKRERAQFRAEREAFAREREVFASERAKLEEAKKPKRDYTLDDLKKYRTQWESEGNLELVERADKEIAAIEAEALAQEKASKRTVDLPVRGTPEHKAMWDSAERELFQADPEFMRPGTRLDTKLREIMEGPHSKTYRDHPQGIYAAYDRAKRELLEEDKKELQTALAKKNEELQRYTGLTSIGGGAPARIGSGEKDFSKLSLADMRKELKRGAKRDGVPWF
jgi:hypothetical protein